MKEKIKQMILEDIEQCEQALKRGNNDSVYEKLFARYVRLDPSILASIPQYAHIVGEHNYDHELEALKTVLETYLKCDGLLSIDDSSQSTNENESSSLIFLSHKSDDKKYADAIEKFIMSIGIKPNQLIYTSHPLHKIPLDDNIYDYLRKNINQKIFMIILWSDKYLESPACLNEMGAAWVIQCDYTNMYVPDFTFGNPKYHECAVDIRKMGAVLNGDDHCKQNMIEFKNKVIDMFGLKQDESKTTYYLDEFMNELKKLQEKNI